MKYNDEITELLMALLLKTNPNATVSDLAKFLNDLKGLQW